MPYFPRNTSQPRRDVQNFPGQFLYEKPIMDDSGGLLNTRILDRAKDSSQRHGRRDQLCCESNKQ